MSLDSLDLSSITSAFGDGIDLSATALVIDNTVCEKFDQDKTFDYYNLMLTQKTAFIAQIALFDEWSWLPYIVPWEIAINMKNYKNSM